MHVLLLEHQLCFYQQPAVKTYTYFIRYDGKGNRWIFKNIPLDIREENLLRWVNRMVSLSGLGYLGTCQATYVRIH